METRQEAIISSHCKGVLDLLPVQLGGQSLQDASVTQDEEARVRFTLAAGLHLA